jgi:methyl-accepting chemotaxis protein
MTPILGDIRSKAKTATLAGVFLLSFTLYGLYCINTVKEVKVNGFIYRDIVRSKDVIADVLPPPEYLVETLLLAYQSLDDGDSEGMDRLAARLGRLRDDYYERHAFWEKSLPPGPLRTALIDSSFQPAHLLLESLDQRFLPALRAGDRARARAVLDREIRPAYQLHRERIDAVVELAKAQNREAEAGAEIAVRSRTYGQIAIGILMFGFLSFFSSYVISLERKAAEVAALAASESDVPARTGAGTRG